MLEKTDKVVAYSIINVVGSEAISARGTKDSLLGLSGLDFVGFSFVSTSSFFEVLLILNSLLLNLCKKSNAVPPPVSLRLPREGGSVRDFFFFLLLVESLFVDDGLRSPGSSRSFASGKSSILILRKNI